MLCRAIRRDLNHDESVRVTKLACCGDVFGSEAVCVPNHEARSAPKAFAAKWSGGDEDRNCDVLQSAGLLDVVLERELQLSRLLENDDVLGNGAELSLRRCASDQERRTQKSQLSRK